MAKGNADRPVAGGPAELQQSTLSELRERGRRQGLAGVNRMTKARLVKEIQKQQSGGHGILAGQAPQPAVTGGRDELVVEAANQRWLRVAWTLTPRTLDRAASSMKSEWHRATPVLRLHHLLCDDSGPRSKEHIADLELPPDAGEWFVNVPGIGETWQVEIGYLTRKGRFFSLLHSTPIELPASRPPRFSESVDDLEQMNGRMQSQLAPKLQIQAELVVTGRTTPDAHVTVDDREVAVQPETGEFQWRTPLAGGRLVIPVVSATRAQQQRVVLSVDSHLRHLEVEPRGYD